MSKEPNRKVKITKAGARIADQWPYQIVALENAATVSPTGINKFFVVGDLLTQKEVEGLCNPFNHVVITLEN